MKQTITADNLARFMGKQVWVFCQVGVLFNVRGKLVSNVGLTPFGIELANGDVIGFRFGQMTVDGDNGCHIYIS